MIRQLYSVVMWALQPLLRRKLARRGGAEAGYLQSVQERFGFYTQPPEAQRELVWVHAVSLGETRAAAVLLQALRHAWPGVRILLTHGTATGRAQGVSLVGEGDVQVWQPWDTPEAVGRFLSHFKPRVGLLMETELWPNWVASCRRLNVPLLMVNARMSEKSMRFAQRLGWLSRPAYQGLSGVFAQTEDDAQRLQVLGAPVQGVFGNLKFDAQPDGMQLAQSLVWKQGLSKPVVMLTSSREGEESMWLDTLQAMLSSGHAAATDVQWLIVPRHPHRFDEVAELLAARGWRVSRRSAWQGGPDGAEASERMVWLGDSLGEMALYYGLADVALLGGSFAPLGGQNLIEATACGCPVIMGPHTFNFAEASRLAEKAGAALRVDDMAQGVRAALQMVNFGPDENAHVQACVAFSKAHRGATQRTVEALAPYLA